MRRARFFLVLLQPMHAHALGDYNYPIARAALAHAGAKWLCTAWDKEHGKCSSYAQAHEDLAVYEQFFASAKRPKAPGVFNKVWMLFVVSDRCQKETTRCRTYQLSRNLLIGRAPKGSGSPGKVDSSSSRRHSIHAHSAMQSGSSCPSKPQTQSP